MKKTGASMMLLTLLNVVLTTFAIAAGAQVSKGATVPVTTGVSSPGQFRQGMQTGTFGQGPAGGVAGGIQNVPGRTGQQQGAGIWVGEMDNRPTGNLPAGPFGGGSAGPGTCQCIRAPCNCPGSPPGGQLPFPGQFPQNQPFPGQFPQNQPFPGQPVNTLPASMGGGNPVFGNVAAHRGTCAHARLPRAGLCRAR
jgi:hypothetical protein